jgi:hypothetical protein
MSNEVHQESIGDDDIRFATLRLHTGQPSWANGYSIEFNGAMLHHSKTYKSFENRLRVLTDKWNLKEVENEG